MPWPMRPGCRAAIAGRSRRAETRLLVMTCYDVVLPTEARAAHALRRPWTGSDAKRQKT